MLSGRGREAWLCHAAGAERAGWRCHAAEALAPGVGWGGGVLSRGAGQVQARPRDAAPYVYSLEAPAMDSPRCARGMMM